MGKLFVFIGPSSSGKDTIFKIIKDDYPELKEVVLYTTRPIRSEEIDGIDYHFISEEEMNELDKKNKLIERRDYDTSYGIWTYATGRDSIDLIHNNYITINTLEGYNKFKRCYESSVVPIYIHVDDDIRLKRALEREKQQENPKFDEVERRFEADKKDFSEEKRQEAGINNVFINNNLYSCVYEIEKFIEKTLDSKQKKRF